MGKSIYVGNLNYKVEAGQLEDVFSEFGDVVSARVILDRETKRSKGFGFVEMGDDDSAATAIEELNGHELEGRTMKVSEATPREEKPRRSFNRRD
ncbi:RNA recognition motif domain-containing protein [Sedimentisphaera salicampi]|uniref:Splicing factor, CC1-like family n=1 Tax=Sedimentisphaera salicampi TaxID=1941349 RepID=A0A1W6LP84_9BACT|nr:RNA-binding protein [Sedimentisphaera salicampi]ARN57556.1 splicing factor, CC1-like family [Sedimentisphaera salicampi]OXU14418.1 splicing factor, CC1-like family [Sedimentisphaera salicampi]